MAYIIHTAVISAVWTIIVYNDDLVYVVPVPMIFSFTKTGLYSTCKSHITNILLRTCLFIIWTLHDTICWMAYSESSISILRTYFLLSTKMINKISLVLRNLYQYICELHTISFFDESLFLYFEHRAGVTRHQSQIIPIPCTHGV